MSDPSPQNRKSRYLASLFGGALGDALGRPTEFRAEPNAGIASQEQVTLPSPALVTDDTQMALAVASALAGVEGDLSVIERQMLDRFVAWEVTDHHEGRAPGQTCRGALSQVAAGVPWQVAADNGSKGSGGIMRTHPVGFIQDALLRRQVASLQARITHGHPTSTVATVAWTEVIAAAAGGLDPQWWMDAAWSGVDAAAEDGRGVDEGQDWDLARDEVRSMLALTEIALLHWDREDDPCRAIGPGWTAEDAHAVSLLIAVTYADSPIEALKRSARTSGDSDTIASCVGALLGAYHGEGAWPSRWTETIEAPYRKAILGMRLPNC